MSSSDYEPLSNIAATAEAAVLVVVPNPTTDNTETPADVAPDEARPPSTIADLNPVPNASTSSDPATIVTTLLRFRFTYASGEARLRVDEQFDHLTIGSLRQLAACFETATPEQNKKKFLLGKFVMTVLNDRGMLVQEGFEWFFDPKLNAPPDGRVAGSPESMQAKMGKQVQAAGSTQVSRPTCAQTYRSLATRTCGGARLIEAVPWYNFVSLRVEVN